MNPIQQIFTPDIVRLIMLAIFGAFMLFYLVYGAFAAYHVFRFGFKGDLSILSLLIFIAGTIALALPVLMIMFS